MSYTAKQLKVVQDRCDQLISAIAESGKLRDAKEARTASFAIGVMAGITMCDGDQEEIDEMRQALGMFLPIVEPE